jgi:hypothetical protein
MRPDGFDEAAGADCHAIAEMTDSAHQWVQWP